MGFTEDLIKRHEGLRLKAYRDTKGILTIFYGFNLEAPGARSICTRFGLDYQALCDGAVLNQTHADAVFSYQFGTVLTQAQTLFPDFGSYPEKVQAVICDLIFNMGLGTFSKFHETIAALKAENWSGAADHLTDSLWFKQVGNRAKEDVALLRSQVANTTVPA